MFAIRDDRQEVTMQDFRSARDKLEQDAEANASAEPSRTFA
jgi:proteasome regulatory subunit